MLFIKKFKPNLNVQTIYIMKTMQKGITTKKCSSVLTIPKTVVEQGRVHTSFHVDIENEILCHETRMSAFIFSFSWKFRSLSWRSPSSETQGQLVGSIKCPWWKFTVRSRRAPGYLLLPNQFQKRLNCPLLIGQRKVFLANWSAKRSDFDVFLHDVVFLIDRHSCEARSAGESFSRKVWELMLTKPGKLQALTRLPEANALRWISGQSEAGNSSASGTFITDILLTRLTAPGSPRMGDLAQSK